MDSKLSITISLAKESKQLTLEVDPKLSVLLLVKRIEESWGKTNNSVVLMTTEAILNDLKTLEEQGVVADTTLHALTKEDLTQCCVCHRLLITAYGTEYISYICSRRCNFVTCNTCPQLSQCIYCRNEEHILQINDEVDDQALFQKEKLILNRNMKLVLKKMKGQYETDFQQRMEDIVRALDATLIAYKNIKKSRDISFAVQCVSTLGGVVATVLLFTPAAPAGIIIGFVKLAVDALNAAATATAMYCLRKTLENALQGHDSLQRNIRFIQFQSDYKILEYYLSAQNLHCGKLQELKTSTNKLAPQLISGTTRIIQGATVGGFHAKAPNMTAGFYSATRWPTNSCFLNEMCKPHNLFALSNAVTTLLDLILLWQSKKNKDSDFQIYEKHIAELKKTKNYYDNFLRWCEENLKEEEINKTDKEFVEELRKVAKDQGLLEARNMLNEIETSLMQND